MTGVVIERSSRRGRKSKHKAKLSRHVMPDGMSLEEWQRGLRRQFGREQKFKVEKAGEGGAFSDYRVTNPASGGRYRVEIRGPEPGDNFCTCPDFATNALGTCKHVEFVLGRLERRQATRAILRAGYHPAHSAVVLKYGARREVRFLAGNECPPGLAVLAAAYFGPDRVLRPEAFGRFEKFLAEAGKFDHDLRCHEDALAFIAEVRDGEERARRVAAEFPRGPRSRGLDKLLKVDLYPYQREGALFAVRAGRCLIGDEMGLGKTIQAIAGVEIMARIFGASRVLVICPTSLKHQWEREIERFSPRSARVIGGLRKKREEHFAADSFYKITNYDTVHKDLDLIAAWSPDVVILDEAQRIKNWNTRAARSVKKIASPYAIVLTGTPLENRLQELVSIVDFVDRHRLGPTYRFLANHQMTDDNGRVIGYRDLDAIGRTLAPILLRRKKSEVAGQLPKRQDKLLFVRMTPEQMRHHNENMEIVARISQKWRRYRFLSEADQRRLMIALQNMRMSCNSTYLLDHTTDFGVKADEAVAMLDDMCEQDGVKAVVFSQWVRTHELLERRMKPRRYGHVLFHGGVPGEQRRGLIDQFREDPKCRVFLSTDAGGVGLNLQHASVVVNMDLPWNPAVLEQRIGRVHRLGQERAVQVINFVAQGTIEEGMLSVLKFKKSLFTGALDGGDKEVFLGGTRLSRFMQTVEKATGAVPAAVTEETGTGAEEAISAEGRTPLAAEAGRDDIKRPVDETRPSSPDGNPWAGLAEVGMTLLGQLAAAARGHGGSRPDRGGISLVRRDAETGKPYLHVPMPPPEVMDRFVSAAMELLGRLRA